MKAVMLDVPESLLEERRRLGHDLFDEMWDGVLHMNPPPSGEHQGLGTELLLVIGPVAQSLGLEPRYETGLYHRPHDYRVPDLLVARPDQLSPAGTSAALLVVEIRSPHDETDDKLDWYGERGVEEICVIDPESRGVELYRGSGAAPALVAPDPDGEVRLRSLEVRLSTLPGSPPRLRMVTPDGSPHDL